MNFYTFFCANDLYPIVTIVLFTVVLFIQQTHVQGLQAPMNSPIKPRDCHYCRPGNNDKVEGVLGGC